MSDKVEGFVKDSNRRLKDFYVDNPDAERFVRPDLSDSCVKERMMRIGMEVRFLQATEVDEFAAIAIATLQDDHVRHAKAFRPL